MVSMITPSQTSASSDNLNAPTDPLFAPFSDEDVHQLRISTYHRIQPEATTAKSASNEVKSASPYLESNDHPSTIASVMSCPPLHRGQPLPPLHPLATSFVSLSLSLPSTDPLLHPYHGSPLALSCACSSCQHQTNQTSSPIVKLLQIPLGSSTSQSLPTLTLSSPLLTSMSILCVSAGKSFPTPSSRWLLVSIWYSVLHFFRHTSPYAVTTHSPSPFLSPSLSLLCSLTHPLPAPLLLCSPFPH